MQGKNKIKKFEENDFSKDEEPNLKGDYGNILILFLLYVLQGVPMGITNSMAVILQQRGATYTEQTIFTIANYPFTLKILWAPIIDNIYFKSVGRRKTWLLPTQLLIGSGMMLLSFKIDEWLGDNPTQRPQIIPLTVTFCLLFFLTATQDISVDGWSITMLQRRNVGYAATVNCVGQSFGALLGFVLFLTLESRDFCNKYIFDEPRSEGLVKFSEFLQFWGVAFLAVTMLIAVFKTESSENEEELKSHPDFGIKRAYPILLQVLKLKPILLLGAMFSTVDISFAAVDIITNLKLIDYGIPKDKIALFSVPSFIVQLALPLIVSKYTAGKFPMNFYFKAFPYRLMLSAAIAIFVFSTPTMLEGKLHDIPTYYYSAFMAIFFFYQIALRSMYTADMSFFAKVADPLVGGTYMTLMNISYVGGKLFKSVSIWLLEIMTWKTCVIEANSTMLQNKCENDLAKKECLDYGGLCRIEIDGYYIEVAVNILFGIIWFQWAKRIIKKLQRLPVSDWHVLSNRLHEKSSEMILLKSENKI